MNEITNKGENYENFISEYSKFLISISPVLPHLSSECLEQFNIRDFSWPSIEEKFLYEENISIVVQFNGKKRGILILKKTHLKKTWSMKL